MNDGRLEEDPPGAGRRANGVVRFPVRVPGPGVSPAPGPDWDVAVYLDDSLDARQRLDIRRGLSAQLTGPDGPRVDLVVLNDAPPLLAHRALKGRELVNRNRNVYVRFFTRVMGEVEDERHFHGVHERARRERLAEGRFGRP